MSTQSPVSPTSPPQQYAPPPQYGQPALGPHGSPRRPTPSKGTGTVIAVLIGALGILVALGAVVTATVTSIAGANVQTTSYTASMAGVSALDVDISAGALGIEFGNVTEAELEVTGALLWTEWTLRESGGTLEVRSERWSSWFPGSWLTGPQFATLILPERAAATLDANINLSAGRLDVTGEFGDLGVSISAGEARIDGAADTLSLTVSAGQGIVALDGVRDASLEGSAGGMRVALRGDTPPERVDVQMSAGSADITLPAGVYALRDSSSAGTVHNNLETSSSSPHLVTAEVSAGSITLNSR